MNKVYQDRFGYGSGNCVWACIATIFSQFTLDDLRYPPPYEETLIEWTRTNLPHLQYNSQDLCTNYRIIDGYPDVEGVGTGRWAYDLPSEPLKPPVPGLWMATIGSPGLQRPVEDSYYPMPALHAVVFEGDEFVHDPNINYVDHWKWLGEQGITTRVLALNWWSATDE